MPPRPLHLLAGLLLTALSAGAGVNLPDAAMAQQRAGVAAAVNDRTEGTPPGGTVRQIVLGQAVIRDETITTDATGLTQLLMLDRTALTIGPNSTLTIDRFIYDPATRVGEMSLTLRRGLLRFTGGAASKSQPVGIRTPVATVGIRGGIGLLEVPDDGTTHAAFLFGQTMTVTRDGTELATFGRPGFGTTITGDGASPPRRWGIERIQGFLERLSGRRSPGDEPGQGPGEFGGRASEDAALLNASIDRLLPKTEALRNGPVGQFFNTERLKQGFNDLPRPNDGGGDGPPKEPPKEPPREKPRT